MATLKEQLRELDDKLKRHPSVEERQEIIQYHQLVELVLIRTTLTNINEVLVIDKIITTNK